MCKACNRKMRAGVEVNDNIYFHGEFNSNNRDESNDSIIEHLKSKSKQSM